MLTYVEQLKQMSNENLLAIALSRNDYVPGYRDAIKAELLSRLNRNPVDENCENCKWIENDEDIPEKGLCWNEKSVLYTSILLDSTIRCMFWEGGKE